jgi:hypothetical protein
MNGLSAWLVQAHYAMQMPDRLAVFFVLKGDLK